MKVFATLAVLWLTLSACEERAADWSDWPLEQALGVRFAVPPHMAFVGNGDQIELQDSRNRRFIDWIGVSPSGGVPARLSGDHRVVEEGAKPAAYTVVELGGGSGGIEYGLSTTKQVDERTVAIFAITQTTGGVPDFPAAWAVWESLAPPP